MTDHPIAVSGTRRAIKELADGTIRVQVDIDPPFRKAFFDLFADIDMRVALAPLVTATATQTEGYAAQTVASVAPAIVRREPNTLAHDMHRKGYFHDPALWKALHERGVYTQQAHEEWIKTLPCVAAWDTALFTETGVAMSLIHRVKGECQGEVVPHHCKSAADPAAGHATRNPQKPPNWFEVPLCSIGHHQNWVHAKYARREDKEALRAAAIQLTANRAKWAMKKYLVLESLRDITQDMLDTFEREIGLQ